MASIGMIHLGGRDSHTNLCAFASGVVFFLHSACAVSRIFAFANREWEVEISQGHQSIVARSPLKLAADDILTRGLEVCQQALDLLSLDHQGDLQILTPGVEHILLFHENQRLMLRQVSLADLSVSTQVAIASLDKDGNIIPEPPEPQIKWIPAFRFYRLSQGSSDLFEAYRNLFLALESLLNEICPKQRREGEKKWLQRALGEVGKRISLSEFVPAGTPDPLAYFINSQYDNIRCKLFHAKGHQAILPHQQINPAAVVDAYATLINMWRRIASTYFKAPAGGGVITNIGFKAMMNGAFENGFTFTATADQTLPTKEDTEVSPLHKALYPFEDYAYINDIKPGQVLLIGSLAEKSMAKMKAIYRIGVTVADTLYSIKYIADGLSLAGIDKFESYQTYRLINKGMPKTIF
jgi:hypothetical protein